MQIVIEQSEFRRLSAEAKREIIQTLAGRDLRAPLVPGKKRGNDLWRQPFDLTPEHATRLLHGMPAPHRARLRLFAEKGPRVTQKALLAATDDTDMRVLSHFQAVLSRRLRRMVHDPEKRLHLIGWDFQATKWSPDRSTIEDGVYYVTDTTLATLRKYFDLAG